MKLKLGVCACQKDKEPAWILLKDYLQDRLNVPIDLVFVEAQEQELKSFKDIDFDIFYAPFPKGIYMFFNKNFLPLFRFEHPKESQYFLVSTSPLDSIKNKKIIKLGIHSHPSYYGMIIPLKLQFDLDFNSLRIFTSDSFKELLNKLKQGDADLVIVLEDAIKNSEETFYKTPIVARRRYYFMLSQKLINELPEVKNAFLSLPDEIVQSFGAKRIIEVSLWERISIFTFTCLSRYIFNFWEKGVIGDSLLKSPYFGVGIYQEKFACANEVLCKLLGYEKEELLKLSPEDIFYHKDFKLKFKEDIQKSLKGELFIKDYKNVVLKGKNNKKIYAYLYSTSVIYNGKFSGLILIIDITSEKRIEQLYKVLKEINQILIFSTSEEEVYRKILPPLVEELELKGAWIGKVLYDKKRLKLTHYYPPELFSNLETLLKREAEILSFKNENLPCIEAVRTKEIKVVEDILEYPYLPEDFKRKAYEAGIRSLCVIPILKENKVETIISLWSESPSFFFEGYTDVLEELQRDLSFALKKIELVQNDLIITNFVRKTKEVLIVADPDGTIQYINPYGIALFEIDKDWKTLNCYDLLNIPKSTLKLLKESGQEIKRVCLFTSEKKQIPLEVRITYLSLPGGVEKLIIWAKDFYKELLFEQEKERLEKYDSLTGLLNYQGFSQKTKELLKVQNKPGALILIDIYNFSYINHFYGIEIGDKCLQEIAERLKKLCEKKGIVGRPEGDTFSMYVINITKENIKAFLEDLRKILFYPLRINEKKILVDFKGSVVLFPDHGKEFEELWKKANILLAEIRKKGLNTIEIYHPSAEKEAERTFQVDLLIRKALNEELFVFYYQPYVEAKTLKIVGCEALVRILEHDKIIPPLEFIEHLENSPYLKEFEDITFYQNLKNILEWKVPISINISPKTFESSQIFDMISKYEDYLNRLPAYLIIEITERSLAKNVERFRKVLKLLKFYRIKVALDDFGTGYSALNYLKDFPIDIVKIDKSFIDLLLEDEKTCYITTTIINLAKKLGIKTLAEGVEQEDQVIQLRKLGIDYMQGFYFAPPLPKDKFKEMLKNQPFVGRI
ncbi:MAG: EAL domain-containing protein [Thermodesulfobacteria bacterium]|nr:EAL domain-containing protein [Thermodesulfobacteriota bacterium]